MESVYMLSDAVILSRIGAKVKSVRLKQNITQSSLAEAANVSLSSVKKIENGEIKSFDSLLRVLRVLGKLDFFQPIVDEEQLSPSEYYELVNTANKRTRKRAVGKLENKKEDSEW
ncbi:MAG: helix-turn-helix domain-containing protein [Bacteroidaceae bacterium]|nr:helix-turn-helix domain-containing protein [Bacteroidaceae bacterium]